jgi:hypothetical protein
MTTKNANTEDAGEKERHAEDVRAFAHHFGEALRIARESDAISKYVFNELADAWNNITNEVAPRYFYDSPEYIVCFFEAVIRAGQEAPPRKGGEG